MDRQDIYYVLFEQQKYFRKSEDLIDREITKDIIALKDLKMPIIITGIRRCGKSSLLKILKDKFNLEDKEFLYINFNDERLINFETSDFQKIMDFIIEHKKKGCTLFLDEIQEVDNWERWIDRIKRQYTIFITGSNSKLLSKEISSVLTGRSVSFELFPFSFKEFLDAKKIDILNWNVDLEKQSRIRKEFKTFLESGGFPQRVITNKPVIVSELYKNILYRDIIKRFNPNLTKQVKEISLYLISNITSQVSLRTLSKISDVKNIATVKNVVSSFEAAFLFFFSNKFDYSLKKQSQNPKKTFCIDNGFIASVGFRFSHDKGKLLENLAAIEIKRRKFELYYSKDKGECDFVVKKDLKILNVIQICYSINEDNKNREIKGLLEAMDKFKLKKGLILTYDQEDKLNIDNKKIIVLPVWKWLLE